MSEVLKTFPESDKKVCALSWLSDHPEAVTADCSTCESVEFHNDEGIVEYTGMPLCLDLIDRDARRPRV